MAAAKIQTRKVDKEKYTNYLKKAQDFFTTMQSAYKAGNWNSTGLEGVHCVISANDALLVFFGGSRSISQDHKDVARLLTTVINTPDAKESSQHLRKVIALKNIIEYEERLFTQKEAVEVMKHAERFFAWVKSMLPN
ncbi:MAG: HEPN domain-containing protein [Candidatus Diapherotrites archaeon]